MKPDDNCRMTTQEADLEPAKLEDMPKARKIKTTKLLKKAAAFDTETAARDYCTQYVHQLPRNAYRHRFVRTEFVGSAGFVCRVIRNNSDGNLFLM